MTNKKYPGKKIAIFESAISLIATNGFHGSPTSKIAEESGISTGSLFRYFKSKDNLINELFEYVEEKVTRYITTDADPSNSVEDQYTHLCRRLIHYSLENPKASSFFNQYIDSPYGVTMRVFKHSKDSDNIHSLTLLYPFFAVFSVAKKQKIVKDMPNIMIFTIIYGAISNFVRDVLIGIIEYSEEIENNFISACWDAIKI